MHRPTIALASIIALAACGEEPTQPKTTDEVVAEAGKLDKPRPGEYETRVDLVEFAVPGLPPQQAETMRAMMAGVEDQANRYCLTEAEAAKGFEDSIRKMTEGNGQMTCDFSKFAVDGGKLAANLACKGAQGMTADLEVDGTASSTASSMTMKMVQRAAMIPGGEIRMEMKMDSRRVGDCPA